MLTNKYLNEDAPSNLPINNLLHNIKPRQTYSIKISKKKKERKKLSIIILGKVPLWVIEEKGIFVALKSGPQPFVVFLASDQFAGKDEELYKKVNF